MARDQALRYVEPFQTSNSHRYLCVLSDIAQKEDRAAIEEALLEKAVTVNHTVEKHERIGAVLLSKEPWTIENELLTPTMKIRRDEVDSRFGEQSRELARRAAVEGKVLVEWMG